MGDHAGGDLGVARAVEVVVVQVQDGVGVSGAGGLEGDGDEVLAEDLGEDGVAQGAVLVEDLVAHVPGPDLALVAGHEGGDVALEDAGQLGLVADVADPAGQLRVPAQRVAADGLVVLDGPVDEVVGLRKVEVVVGRLGRVPLHRVLRRHLPKVGLDHVRRLAARQPPLIRAGAVVQLALGLDQRVDARRRLALLHDGGGDGGCCQQENGAELHGLGWDDRAAFRVLLLSTRALGCTSINI